MKSLIGLLLAISMALPACSADNGSSVTPEPAATPDSTVSSVATAPDADAPAPAPDAKVQAAPDDDARPAPIVLAESDKPAPATPVAAPAPRSDIVAGKHYTILTPTQPTSSSPDKVELAEVFMYSCPHCQDLEPFIDSYLQSKPDYVSFVRIPALFNKPATMHAKAFYMAETLGVIEKIHKPLFVEYHTNKNRLSSEKAIIDFFVKQGVPRDDVTSAYNSFAVDTKVRHAGNLGMRYDIRSVPTLVINGKYVTSASMTGSFNKLREVVEYLTAKEGSEL